MSSALTDLSHTAMGVVRPAPGRDKILVVDDEESMRMILPDLLEDFGYTAVCAGTGREALDLVRRERPQLVLADVSMPGMDGYALLVALQEDPLTRDCPVVLMTGRITVHERARAFELGARDVLVKPFAGEALIAKIACVLGDGR
jgi:CheY-like chemotaxis protein